jgi:predicted ATPase
LNNLKGSNRQRRKKTSKQAIKHTWYFFQMADETADTENGSLAADDSASATTDYLRPLFSPFSPRQSTSTERTSSLGMLPRQLGSSSNSSNRRTPSEVEILPFSVELERASKLTAINRLRFDTLGLFGRRDEIALLYERFQRLQQQPQLQQQADSRYNRDDAAFDTATKNTTSTTESTTTTTTTTTSTPTPSEQEEDASDKQHEKSIHRTTSPPTRRTRRRCEFVFVSGASGTGKTTLAATLQGAAKYANGVWVHGKYDMTQKLGDPQRPLAGMGAVCNELCRVVLDDAERKPELVQEIRHQLEVCLDRPLLALIENVIPLLGLLLSSSSSLPPSQDAADTSTMFAANSSDEFSRSGEFQHWSQSNLPGGGGNGNNRRKRRSLRRRRSRIRRIDDHSKGSKSFSSSISSSDAAMMMRIEPGHSRELLQFALRTFLQIFTSIMGPVVAVVDDLQWADDASLELLQAVATDPLISNLMIVGCYRSTNDTVVDDDDKDHLLSKVIQDLKVGARTEEEYGVTEISIGNLSNESVKEMLMDLLSVPEQRIQGLSDICYKRTMGNVFFVKVFLTMLHDANILEFQMGSFQWTWDDSIVEMESAATENVVDVIKAKMEKYPDDMKLLLKVASCLGNAFERDIVELLWSDLEPKRTDTRTGSLEQLLKVAVRDMLFEPVGEDSYRFVHDKIQETALLLIPDTELATFQSSIGNCLYLNMEDNESQMLFVMADLLNNGSSSGVEIAELNAKAAERAKDVSAFVTAVRYVEYGIMCLKGSDIWKKHSRLALKLYSIGAEAEECIGNVEKSIWYCSEVRTQKAITTLDKMRANKIVVERLYSDGKYKELWKCCLDILDTLGCRLPRKRACQKLSATILLAKTKRFDFPQPEAVDEMFEMEDSPKREALEFMIKVASFCLASKNKPLYILLCCKCVRLTTQYGLTCNTAPVFASFANVLMHEDGDWRSALKVADLALAIDKRFVSNYAKTSTLHKLNSFVLGWVRPLRTTRTGYLEAYRLGMLSGNIEGVGMAILFLLMSQFFSGGCTLQSIDQDLRQYVVQLERLKLHSFVLGLRLLWQKIFNLMDVSYNHETTSLTGTAMHGIDIERHPFIFNTVGRHHICNLCAYFSEYEKGAEIALAMGESFYQTWSGASYFGFEPFSRALCLYATAQERPGQAQRYLGAARKAHRKLSKWVKAGAINLVHQMCILDAEEAAVRDNPRVVTKKYEKAIRVSGRGGFLQDTGIASERFAVFLLRQAGVGRAKGKSASPVPNPEMIADASYRMSQAIMYFSSWGAHRKVQLLKHKYSALIRDDDLSTSIP